MGKFNGKWKKYMRTHLGGRYEIHNGDGYKNWNKSSKSVLIDHSSGKNLILVNH